MDQETLFKLIRQQEIVLWAGSGLSHYAGYAMGAGVVGKLYDSLSSSLKRQLAEELGDRDPLKVLLPEFAELYINLHKGNRHALNRVVIDEFSAAPKARHVHEQLASIPYVEHIITTNYDKLFELTHQPLNTVYHSNKLPLRKRGQPTLYKIHGHLDDPDSLVISTSDYLRFFEKADQLLWKQLESLMASHTLVFIGYAVEDPNVLEVFLRVCDMLGSNMRPAYVVSPSMSDMKLAALERRNIHYIKATGEEFVEALLADIKKNSLLEVKRGEVAVDATRQLLNKQGLNYVFHLDEEGANCTDLRRKEGETTGRLRFSAPMSSPVMQGLAKLHEGESLKVVKMVREDLTEFSIQVEGFEMPLSEDITNFWIARSPVWQKKIAVRFSSGLLLTDVGLKAYGSNSHAQFVVVDRYSRAVISMAHPSKQLAAMEEGKASLQFTLSYSKRRPGFDSVEAALAFVDTMIHLGRGERFEVLENWVPIWQHSTQPPVPTLLRDGENLRELLLVLQKIEQCFGIKFQHFNLDGQDLTDVDNLNALLDHEEVEYTWPGSVQATLDMGNELAQRIVREQGDGFALVSLQEAEPRTYDILGYKIQLSYQEKVTTLNPVLRELSEGVYDISSQTQRITRQLLEITGTQVLSVPPAVAPAEPTPAELLDDMLPDD